ncbi:MAG: hypothetical protein ABIT01_20550 [Thermoanaerobaculia bacterium]
MLLLATALWAPAAHAWIYPEHRDISDAALRDLDAERQTKLRDLWALARTGHGRFQLVAGREIGVTFFGYVGGDDRFLALTPTDSGLVAVPIALRSIEIDAPILEYRPFREFTSRQTFTLQLQLGVGVSIPEKVRVLIPPEYDVPGLSKSYFGYVRLGFDFRRYL